MSNTLTSRISIREWKESDFDSAVVLNREASEHINLISESGDWARDLEDVSETFMRSGGEFIVGHIDEQMIVMGGFKLLSNTIAEIKRMRVSPMLQGQGIGYWFVDLLEERMQSKGISTANVSTTTVQEGALRLYTGIGYAETGREVITDGPGQGLTLVSFTKSLAA